MQYSPGVLSVLPLFYIGWSDSVLSPTEMHAIHQHIKSMEFLSKDDHDLLISWTQQSNPPSAETFKYWLEAIKQEGKNLNISSKVSLVDFGLQMAQKSSGANAKTLFNEPKVKASIVELEIALGLSNQISKNNFYRAIDVLDSNDAQVEDTFDVFKMQKILDGPYHELKTEVKKYISDPFFNVPIDLKNKDALRDLVLEQCKALGKCGYGPSAYPLEFGGSNSPGDNTAIFETLALGNMSLLVKFGVQFGLFGGAIFQLGTKEHHQKYLKDTGSLELAGCFAMTETGHGSNVKDLETTATYEHNSKTLIIHSPSLFSGKEYIGNALHSKVGVVFAQLIVGEINYGIHAVVVPLRNAQHDLLPGVTIIDNGYKLGLNGVDNGRIWFDNVIVPVENLLNKYGGIDQEGNYSSSIEKESKRFFTMLGALVGGRVSVALASNMAAKKSLDIAIKYALKRRQFSNISDGPESLIMDYPTHQWRLLPLVAKSYALTFALETLRSLFKENYGKPDQRAVETLAAGLKSYASWHATSTIQECREACGGKGYLSENEFADLKADTEIFTTFEGDNHVLLQLVAKSLLTELKQEFNDGGFFAIAKHLLSRFNNKVITLNPIFIRNTDAEHILNFDFHAEILSLRTEKLRNTLSDRMRKFMSKKINAADIFLKVQTHMVTLAKAYVEEYIQAEFMKKIALQEESQEKQILTQQLQLFGLHTIYENAAWFLENEFISPDKSKAIRKVLDKLIRDSRPNAGALVEAFGIPEALRKAKIVQE